VILPGFPPNYAVKVSRNSHFLTFSCQIVDATHRLAAKLTLHLPDLYTIRVMANQAVAESRPPVSGGPNLILTTLIFLGETWTLAAQALSFLLRGKLSVRNTVAQMAAIGVDSLPIVIATTLSTGAVYAFYTSDIFVRFGAVNFVGGTLTLSFLLELGPVLAGVTVASRSGAAIAAEIGSMVVTEQVDALRAMAVSPIRYLVAPRLVACVLMMPLVGVFADLAGILGCYLMAGAHGVPPNAFIESARTYATGTDLIKGLVKTLFFGLTIAIVACHQGLKTKGGATGVGRATTSSVVLCVVLIFVLDFFLAQLLSGASVAVK
jgi:phospholipid/cholesterol/gamma-HCH transport system permease protein